MINLKSIFLFFALIASFTNSESINKQINFITMNHNFSIDSSIIHKVWELKNIKIFTKGMGGIDKDMEVLDFRDREKMYIKDENNEIVDTIYYKIDSNNILAFFHKRETIAEKSETDVVFKIKELTETSLIISAVKIDRNHQPIKYADLIELHYKVKE